MLSVLRLGLAYNEIFTKRMIELKTRDSGNKPLPNRKPAINDFVVTAFIFPIGNGEWSPETSIVGFVIGYDEAGGSVTVKVPSRPAITYTVGRVDGKE
jgi:hypothetical protein